MKALITRPCPVRGTISLHTTVSKLRTGVVMGPKIGDTASDFMAETTEGRIKFHDWIGDS
jgi:hypothetical protein